MILLILDTDPYEEYYIGEDKILNKEVYDSIDNYFVYDTVLLVKIILDNELDKYFKKLK